MPATLVSLLILGVAPRALAQEPPPDPRMLLNLDLFSAGAGNPADGPSGAAGHSGSLVDQIRTLRALGYLGRRGNQADGSDSAPPDATPPDASDGAAGGSAPPYGDQPEVQP